MYLPTESRSWLVCICAQIWKNMLSLCYFTTFWCFRGPLGAVLLPIPFVDANNIFYSTQFGVLRLCFRGVHLFFSWPATGLTNQLPVWDSRAGNPLSRGACNRLSRNEDSMSWACMQNAPQSVLGKISIVVWPNFSVNKMIFRIKFR